LLSKTRLFSDTTTTYYTFYQAFAFVDLNLLACIMTSKCSLLTLNGDRMTNVSCSRQQLSNSSCGASDLRGRGCLAGTTRPTRASSAEVHGNSSIPSGRGNCTPTMVCTGHSCVEMEDSGGLQVENTRKSRRSSHDVSTPPLRTSQFTMDDCRQRPQPQ